jgi:hypothetical protein
VAWEAAELRARRLFGDPRAEAVAGRRARVIAVLAERRDSAGGEVFRRLIAALAVDAPADLVRAVTAAVRREWSARRHGRSG